MGRLALRRALLASAAMGNPAWQQLLTALTMPDQSAKTVMLEYVDASTRYVWTPILDLYWVRWTMKVLASGFWVQGRSDVYECIKAWSDRDASVSYAGGAFSQGNSFGTLNGTWSYSQTVGRYAEFAATPGADGRIYVVVALESNGGIANVTIDGAATLVNELPLVGANRQLDCYAASEAKNTRVLIASGLTPGQSYTVRVTVTGTKNASSSDEIVYFEGYGVTPYNLDDAVMVLAFDRKAVKQIGNATSNSNEYAYSILPTGAAGYEWTGQEHLNEVVAAVAWQDGAGADISVSAEDTKNNAAAVVVVQTGTTRHSETGATDLANITLRHTFDHEGMTIYHNHAWLVAGVTDRALTAMWRIVAAASPSGHIAGLPGIIDLTTDDDAYDGGRVDRLVAAWNGSASWVGWVYLPDPSIVSTTGIFIQDEAAATANKIYIPRAWGTAGVANAAISIGDNWPSTARYRISYIPNPTTAINWI